MQTFLRIGSTVLLAASAGCASMTNGAPGAAAGPLVVEEMEVASDPGIRLYVRNKRLASQTAYTPAKTVLFLHGATYPSESAFDLRLDGTSWMDYIARRGYDVYLMDVRGYGRSTRPPAMDRPASEGAPFANTEQAAADLGAVIDAIRARRGIPRVNLLAWSWGTSIGQTYASVHSDKLEKLVLYAPVFQRQTASLVQAAPGPLGAYRMVNMTQAKQRWLTGVPPDKVATLIPPGWFEAWAEATLASDPVGAKMNPPVVRAPNGVVEDSVRRGNGPVPWKPENIRVPVLLIKAEWDQDTPAYMAQALFPRLTGAPYKRYVEIGEGTHSVIMERNRMQLFREVQMFLDEPYERAR